MSTTLLTTGLACLIAAIVGGGLKAFGIELPVLPSTKRQVLLAVLGLALIGAGATVASRSRLPPGGRAPTPSASNTAICTQEGAFPLTPKRARELKEVVFGLAEIEVRDYLCGPLLAKGYTADFVNTTPAMGLPRLAIQLHLLE